MHTSRLTVFFGRIYVLYDAYRQLSNLLQLLCHAVAYLAAPKLPYHSQEMSVFLFAVADACLPCAELSSDKIKLQ